MKGTLVVLQPTSFCNIDCKYCYLPNRSSTKRMSEAVLENILSVVLRSPQVQPPVTFVHHAGEPLTLPKDYYRAFSERLSYYATKYDREAEQSIQTNATLVDAEWVELFKRYGIGLGVSIDGPQFIHDRNRVTRSENGTHEKVMRGVKLLQQADLDFNVIMVLTDFALDYPDEIYEFFVENDIKYVGFNIDEFGATPYISSYVNGDWDVVVQRYRYFMKRLLELVDMGEGRLVVREFTKIAASLLRDANGQKRIFNGVRTPLNILNFDVDGNFSTFSPELLNAKSEEYGDFLMGNIYEHEIQDILGLPKFQRIHHSIEIGADICGDTCNYWRFCGGGSPADKFFEFGRFDVAETTACKIHKKVMIDVYLEHLTAGRENSIGSL